MSYITVANASLLRDKINPTNIINVQVSMSR